MLFVPESEFNARIAKGETADELAKWLASVQPVPHPHPVSAMTMRKLFRMLGAPIPVPVPRPKEKALVRHAAAVATGFAQGLTLKQIGDQIGVSRQRVRQLEKFLGLSRRTREDIRAKAERTRAILEKSLTMQEAVEALGITPSGVYAACRRLGLVFPPGRRCPLCGGSPRSLVFCGKHKRERRALTRMRCIPAWAVKAALAEALRENRSPYGTCFACGSAARFNSHYCADHRDIAVIQFISDARGTPAFVAWLRPLVANGSVREYLSERQRRELP